MPEPILPPPSLIHCSRCGFRGGPDVFSPNVPLGEGAYTCPGSYARGRERCGMDESGLNMFWDGDALHEWWNRVIDWAASRAHDASMNDSATPMPIPRTLPPGEARRARQELSTDPDFQEQIERMAERVRVALYGDDDGFEDWLEDAMISWFPTFERYQMSFDVDPNDDNFVALEEEVRRVIHEEIRKRIGPLMMKILKTGDWHDATPPEQEN